MIGFNSDFVEWSRHGRLWRRWQMWNVTWERGLPKALGRTDEGQERSVRSIHDVRCKGLAWLGPLIMHRHRDGGLKGLDLMRWTWNSWSQRQCSWTIFPRGWGGESGICHLGEEPRWEPKIGCMLEMWREDDLGERWSCQSDGERRAKLNLKSWTHTQPSDRPNGRDRRTSDGHRLSRPPSVQLVGMGGNGDGDGDRSTEPSRPWGTVTACTPS
jgi:hypothetical protein